MMCISKQDIENIGNSVLRDFTERGRRPSGAPIDIELLHKAVESLQEERADALAGKAERLLWMEHFKRFEGLTELERRTVVNLIQSVRVMSKTELQIAFNYHVEYEEALSLMRKEAA